MLASELQTSSARFNGVLELCICRINEINKSLSTFSHVEHRFFRQWTFVFLCDELRLTYFPILLATGDVAWTYSAFLSAAPRTMYIRPEVFLPQW